MKRKKRTKSKSAPKVKRTKKPSPIIAIPLILISLFVLIATIYKIIEIISANNSATDFPKLEISLTEVPIEQIDANSKDIKYPGNTATFTINKTSTTFDDVEIKGRGNTTWQQLKKPYQIKTMDESNILNLGENKKWVLLANYLDTTHLRNDIAFHLEKLLNEKYRSKGSFIELYIDSLYHGLYYLSDKIEISNSRINLADPLGIIIEIDNIHEDPTICKRSQTNDCVTIKDVVSQNYQEEAFQNFLDSFNLTIEAINKKDYYQIQNLIDIDSFAKYFLLNEFTVNPDAYSTSFYMYKDGNGDKIHAGPGWDFDLAFSNKSWVTQGVDIDSSYSPFETMFFKSYINNPEEVPYIYSLSTVIYDLMDIPEFETKVKEIYQSTLSGHKEDLLNYIKSQADYIRPAALRDQERWKLKTNFDEEVDYLIDWVSKRYDHFEEVYGQNPTESTPTPAPESPQPELEQPAPQD
ncbi:CotH kinase family protein [Candidatus Saccharibacteria bacterium]|nr:CotH kinase family protein [Candidatus Saccharibacteria bacterium]